MEGKYFLLILLVTCSQEVTQAHIIPFAHDDFPVQECVRELTQSVVNLCSVYGEYASDLDNMAPLFPRGVIADRDRWDSRLNVLRSCCLKPCTVPELLAIC